MKAWLRVYHGYGEAVQRIALNLRAHAPGWVEFVEDWRQAELTVDLLVDSPLGSMANRPRSEDPEHWHWHHQMLTRITGPQLKGLFFVCCFENSELLRYAAREAKAVFSFLPDFPQRLGEDRFNFVLQPLGVDPEAFALGPSWEQRPYDVYTWGYVAETEGIDLIHEACVQANRRMLHSGADFGWPKPACEFREPAAPEDVVNRYQQARYANAMRLPYGFELAALEGTLCGCRPICFDLPCYRHWLGDLPSYVPAETVQGDRSHLSGEPEAAVPHPRAAQMAPVPLVSVPSQVKRLIEILGDLRPTTLEERSLVRRRFNWRRVAGLFWDALGRRL
jgi:hypothetical protein